MAIKQNFLIEKRNVLNEIRANGMTLQELRFFSIYLSKINPRDISTRIVRFSLPEFQRIMEFKGHLNLDNIKQITNSLLCKVVNVPTGRGGYEGFQLFTHCKVDRADDGQWYVEINAHDQALPLMFEFKERYFTYELWNALRLKSANQLRMYEILKQYERMGERIISVKELKALLGIGAKNYPRYGDFKTHVLDVCQKSLSEYTDIKFMYEPTGKKGQGGKVLNLKFKIEKNDEYTDRLTLSEFINQQEFIDAKEKIDNQNEPLVILDNKNEDGNDSVERKEQLRTLGFIQEMLSENELLSIFNAANGDIALIHRRYEMARQKTKLENLVGFLIWAVKQPDEQFKNTASIKKNKFSNFEQRKRNYAEIEKLERKYLLDSLQKQGKEE